MRNEKKSKKGLIALVVLSVVALMVTVYWFQHKTVVVGAYTVTYYKNRCDVDPETLSAGLESLKTLHCLIRISWQESISPDMYQEYCYRPGKGVEKTRLIHKKN